MHPNATAPAVPAGPLHPHPSGYANASNRSDLLPKVPDEEDLDVNTDIYSKVMVTVIYLALFLVGTVGNSITAYTLVRKKSLQNLQSTVHYHLASLAFSDLLIFLLCMPIELYNFIWVHHPWAFGGAVCKGYYFLRDACTYATALNIASLSMERYMAICHPFKAKSIMSRSRTKKFISCIWIASFRPSPSHDTSPWGKDLRQDGDPELPHLQPPSWTPHAEDGHPGQHLHLLRVPHGRHLRAQHRHRQPAHCHVQAGGPGEPGVHHRRAADDAQHVHGAQPRAGLETRREGPACCGDRLRGLLAPLPHTAPHVLLRPLQPLDRFPLQLLPLLLHADKRPLLRQLSNQPHPLQPGVGKLPSDLPLYTHTRVPAMEEEEETTGLHQEIQQYLQQPHIFQPGHKGDHILKPKEEGKCNSSWSQNLREASVTLVHGLQVHVTQMCLAKSFLLEK
ncbi:neurotensin receptor type 1 [Manacus vitellinus]|uniref:neurotensin receptor type 1 n=1 Tax=Manacus vitellinus TaxID=328815 RepID=UPI00115CFABE|nr:neurotensin receptor type 1 [Manacus vitellinus]